MTIDNFHGEYRFLSNFWYAKVKMSGKVYPSVEHAFQAAKTLDEEEREKIRNAKTPSIAKKLGREITIRPDWNEQRIKVMEECLRQKFSPGTDLAKRLIATYPSDLIEGNYWNDTFWGVCKGIGENNLGKLLMKIREDLVAEI